MVRKRCATCSPVSEHSGRHVEWARAKGRRRERPPTEGATRRDAARRGIPSQSWCGARRVAQRPMGTDGGGASSGGEVLENHGLAMLLGVPRLVPSSLVAPALAPALAEVAGDAVDCSALARHSFECKKEEEKERERE